MKQDIVTLERQTGHRNLVMRRRFNRLLRGGGPGLSVSLGGMRAKAAKAAAQVQAKLAEAAVQVQERTDEAAALATALAKEKAAEAAARARAKLAGMTQIAREKAAELAELAKATLRAAAEKAEKEAELAQAKASRLNIQLTDAAKQKLRQKLIASLDQSIAIFDRIINEYETQGQSDTKDNDIRELVTCMFNGALRLKKDLPQMIATALSSTHSAQEERDEYQKINNKLTQNYLNQGCYVHFDPRVYKYEDTDIMNGGLPFDVWSHKKALTVMTHKALEDSVDAILDTCTRDGMSIIDKWNDIKKLTAQHAYNKHDIFVYRFIRPFEGET